MANLSVILPDGQTVEVAEIDFASETPNSLISELFLREYLTDSNDDGIYLIQTGKDSPVSSISEYDKSFEELGIKDQEQIAILLRSVCQ